MHVLYIALRVLSYLYFVQHSSAVHSAGHIYRVTPNIILRFMSSNHSCNYWPMVYSCKCILGINSVVYIIIKVMKWLDEEFELKLQRDML